ncbi:MAG TPA: hypothetical protein PLN52_21320 [Opitutaceae bacterium]|nr:hypothetical protein [Opitutaceae bacterium]
MISKRGPAILFALMALVLIMALYGTHTNAWTGTHLPVPAGAAPTPSNFGLGEGEPSLTARTDSRFEGGVFVALPPYTWFGTFVGGDDFKGKATSTTFPIKSAALDIPLLGYPNSPDTRLDLEILNADGTVLQQITYKGDNPGERIGYWLLSTEEWKGSTARLHLTDNSAVARGWLGIAYPLERERIGIAWLHNLPRNYGWYTLQILTVISLLFLPGLALKTWLRDWNLHPALLPLPGLTLLAATGLGIWTRAIPFQPRHLGYVWLIASICTASVLMWVNLRPRLSFTRQDRQVLFVYFAICVGALSFGVLPLEVAEEQAGEEHARDAEAHPAAGPNDCFASRPFYPPRDCGFHGSRARQDCYKGPKI